MLFGQDLRGCHQRRLVAVRDRVDERHGGYGGLAGADFTLEQAGHRQRPFEVAQDLADDPLLGAGEREGQTPLQRLQGVGSARQRDCATRLPLVAALQDRELDRQQLLEREPVPCLLEGLSVRRKVERAQCLAESEQLELLAHRRRQRIGHGVGEVDDRPVDARAQRLVEQTGGGRVDWHEPARVDRWIVGALEFRILEGQAPPEAL